MDGRFDPELLEEWKKVCRSCRYNHTGKECKEKQCHNCGHSFYGPYIFLCPDCEQEESECPICRKRKQYYYIKCNFGLCKECFVRHYPF